MSTYNITIRQRRIYTHKTHYANKGSISSQIGEEDMVGIFSRFYVGRGGHRRTQSALVSTLSLSLSFILIRVVELNLI